jgi:hypothetical protein
MASDRDEIYDEQGSIYGEPAQGGDSELAWLAFRYITGELAPAEAAEFEVRLESDQAAREAVAAMVELAAMVEQGAAVEIASHAAPAIEPGSLYRAAAEAARLDGRRHSSAPRRKFPAGGMALATAASLAAVLVAYSLAGRNERPGSFKDQRDSTSLDRQLADAWAATVWRDGALVDRPLATDDERPLEFDLLPENLAADALSEADALDEDDPLVAGGGSAVAAWESADGELMISDWLWEAVSGAQEGAPTEPDPRGNQGEG